MIYLICSRFSQMTIIITWIKVVSAWITFVLLSVLLCCSVTFRLTLHLYIFQIYATTILVYGDWWRLTNFTQYVVIDCTFILFIGWTTILIVNLNFFLLFRFPLVIMMRLWRLLHGLVRLCLLFLGLSQRGLLVFNRRVLAILKTHLLLSCQ